MKHKKRFPQIPSKKIKFKFKIKLRKNFGKDRDISYNLAVKYHTVLK
jgi:hypothetical protein